jgi:hypothetical protein
LKLSAGVNPPPEPLSCIRPIGLGRLGGRTFGLFFVKFGPHVQVEQVAGYPVFVSREGDVNVVTWEDYHEAFDDKHALATGI